MVSEKVEFQSQSYQLGGVLSIGESPSKMGVLLLHPHPLYGGDMNNPVVTGLERVFLDEGFTTLRFNFRGVSTPGYTGVEGAVLDATNALKVLNSRGIEKVGLAGYSFGGSTALRLASVTSPQFLVTLSASKALVEEGGFELDNLSNVVCPVLMFHGSKDQMTPTEDLRVLSSAIGSGTVKTIRLEGEGHFYQKHLSDVLRTVKVFITQ